MENHIISETLPPPFKKNIHYIEMENINQKKFEDSYLNMSKLLCSRFSFNKFIKKVLAN